MARQEDEYDWEDGVDVRWIQGKRISAKAPAVGPWVWTFFAILVGAVLAMLALGVLALGWWR